MDIKELLDKNGVQYKNTNNPDELLVHCLSGNHVDSNPSMSVNTEKCIFNCWSCGFKGGRRSLLRLLGVRVDVPIASKQEAKIEKLRNKINSMTKEDINLPEDAVYPLEPFRGLSLATLEEFGAFYTEKHKLGNYISFPIYQGHKLKFIESRRRSDQEDFSDEPKYKRMPAGVNVKEILFPLDKLRLKDDREVYIVEGLFDMLNLWELGYRNVLCTFGVHNFSVKKTSALDQLGVLSVNILFDGDAAGMSGAHAAEKVLSEKDFKTRIINLPFGRDPGSLTAEEANFIFAK